MSLTAEIVFPLPLPRSFRYSVPAEMAATVRPGVRVAAPLGTKTHTGFIIRLEEGGPADGLVLKEILDVLDADPVVTAGDIAFAQALAAHFRSSTGEFLQAMLPPSLEFRGTAKTRLTEAGLVALRDGSLRGEERSVAVALGDRAYTIFHLKRASRARNVSAVVRRLESKGLVVAETRRPGRVRGRVVPVVPTPAQLELDFTSGAGDERIISPLLSALGRREFASFYIFGGRAGRWDAYAAIIRRALGRPGQILLLVPELSPLLPLKDMLEKRLGADIVLFHGQQTDREREEAWRRVRNRSARIAIGPRSALFSPVGEVGAVLVDEEHDDAYDQSESPAYDARYGARLLAVRRGALLVSGSYAPTIEAYYRAKGEGTLISLPAGDPPSTASIVDDRAEGGLIARDVAAALRRALDGGKNALVFLNRRGYASFLFCPACGAIPRCDRCRVPLTYYKKVRRLTCRYGHVSRAAKPTCLECGSPVLEPRGAGIEAAEEELKRLFPKARVGTFDGAPAKTKAARDRIVARFAEKKIDILAGTQSLAHRADLPPAAFVVVLNPEALLAVADIRAGHKTYATIRRMMGSAAAPGAGGEAVIQTAFPDHHAILAAARGEYAAFYDKEIALRRLMDYPPFSVMAAITLYGRDGRALGTKARELVRRAGAAGPEIEILGPAFAPPSWPRGEKGVDVILWARSVQDLDACLGTCLESVGAKTRVVRYD